MNIVLSILPLISPMERLPDIIAHFQIPGNLLVVEPYGSGHINETYASTFSTSAGIARFVHQRINHHVFLDPGKVMANIEKILDHTRQALRSRGEDTERGCLRLVPTIENNSFCKTDLGDYWRTFKLIEDARTYDLPENDSQVYEAAYAFGKFQENLADLPADELFETIVDFHNTPKRFQKFLEVLVNDPCSRSGKARDEIKFILEREKLTGLITQELSQGSIPIRVTHNDTKLNNVLIDDRSGKGICVIDLDTVMPGSALYDFGDMVRSSASNSAEDEPDTHKAGFNANLFENLVHGYLDATRNFLTTGEIHLLAQAGVVITLEQAIRFLTDFLNGDLYYKIKYPDHNLVRCRTQIKLISDMESQQHKIDNIIRKYQS
jgi:hypothetical protein